MQVRVINGTTFSAQSLRALRPSGEVSSANGFTVETQSARRWRKEFLDQFIEGIRRRWLRERRRRKVGRAYDMALEVARIIPRGSAVLDVGCGNGFIAHHLSAMLATSVIGIDVRNRSEAAIDYRQYDGSVFPLPDNSVDVVLLCYVLHHAQDVAAVLGETRRVLRQGGVALVYEDIPVTWWDRWMCWFHNRQWETRTGPCAFHDDREWIFLFDRFGFEMVFRRRLSRWRNSIHPIRRAFFFLRWADFAEANGADPLHTTTRTLPDVREVQRYTRTNQEYSSSSEVESLRVGHPSAAPPAL